MKSYWLDGTFEIRQRVRVSEDREPGPLEGLVVIGHMPCTEEVCEPATSLVAAVVATVEAGAPRTAADSAAAPVRRGGGDQGGLTGFLLLAVGAGLLALVMPCTYPMIPITISFFTKQGEARGGKVLPLAIAYGAGIIAIFVLIGVIVGPVIIEFAVHPVTNLLIAVLFIAFSLVLFGVWNLQPPRFLMNLAGKASSQGGFLGVFLMGATLVVTSFTCTAPFVGSLLSLGASGGDIGRVALGMGVFGATMAVPFVLLSLVPGALTSMPKSGEWMHTIKVFLGFLELAAALKFLSNADLAWRWDSLPRELFLYLWAGIFAVGRVLPARHGATEGGRERGRRAGADAGRAPDAALRLLLRLPRPGAPPGPRHARDRAELLGEGAGAGRRSRRGDFLR
jgi:thiol:disulfide interchange protein